MFAFLLAFIRVFPQFSLSGKILNDSGEILAGASVILENTFTGTISDSNGNYILKNLSGGEKSVRVTYIGYATMVRKIILTEDVQIDFILKPARIIGEEVIIKAVRATERDPVAFSMLKKEDIERSNLGKDIPSILTFSPSLVTTSDAGTGIGYTNFRIRGTDANRINITVNGIPLNDAESHSVFFVDLPDLAGSTDNIQIQRGVGTSTNGSAAFGASINFQTLKLSSSPYGEVNSAFGSFNTFRQSVSLGTGLIKDRFSFDARLSSIHSDGYIDRASSDLSSWFLSGTWQTGKTLLKINTFSGDEYTYQAWDGVPGYMLDSARTYNGMGRFTDENGKIRFYKNEIDKYRQDHYQLHFLHEISSELNITAALHLTRGTGYYEQYREDQDLEDYLIPEIIFQDDTIRNSDLIRRLWLDNYFYGTVFSANLTRKRFDAVVGAGFNRYEGNHYGTVIWARNMGNAEADHIWYRNRGYKSDFNTFARLNYSVTERINLYSDLQVRGINYRINGKDDDQRDITQEHDFLFFNPKLGLNFRLNDDHRAYFSFSVASREPNRDNFVDASPYDPSPRQERLYDYELGYDFHKGNLKAGINLYYMDYKDQLVLTGEINDVGAPVMKNVPESYRKGVEFSLACLFNEWIGWQGNLTLSSNKIKKFRAFVDNWNYWDNPADMMMQYSFDLGTTDIAFSPSVIASGILSLSPLENMEISIQSKYIGKQYIDNTGSDERKLDPWFVNDLSISYSPDMERFGKITFNVLVANLFNSQYESNAWVYRYIYNGKEYREDGYFPQAGIHFLAGIKVRF